MTKHSTLFADTILIIVAAIWGGGFVAGKMALTGLTPLAILMYRFCISAVFFAIVFFPKIKKSTAKEIKWGCIIGGLQFIALFIQLFGLQYTTSAKQSFIAASYVMFTPFLAWMITKIRPGKKEVAAAALALFGIALISLSGGLNIQIGDPITLGFALVFSLQIVIVGKYTTDLDVFALTFYQFAFAGILSALAVLISGTPVEISGISCWGGTIYLALINTGLAICLQNFAQKYTKESHAALLLSLESVFGFGLSILIYGNSVTPRMILGCILILCAILMTKVTIPKN